MARPPVIAVAPHDALDAGDRLEFERLLQWLRLSFMASPVLVLLAFGPRAWPFALLIAAATTGSYAWVWLLMRRAPNLLLRLQLGLRVADCALIFLVLHRYHAFLGDAYYDAVYLLFVAAAAATHGRRGALLLSLLAGGAVLLSRQQLMAVGALAPEPRHVTDAIFYTIFFAATGIAVAFLMRKSGEVAARRERAWQAEVADRNAELERMAAELKSANADLQSLARENARLYRRAEEALHLSRDVLASASHDLKNPLVTIRAYAQLLQADAGRKKTPSGAWRAERLGKIDAATHRIQVLADELADVARLEMGERLALNLAPTDLVALAMRVVDLAQAGTTSHTLRLETESPSLVGTWDEARLERVLANVVHNAVKYSPGGGDVVVSVAVGPDETARATVRDSGVGIPEADLPHLFERFRRGSNVSASIPGTGLGLAGARTIIGLHGGTIEAISREGQGTSVTITLPLQPPEGGAPGGAGDPLARSALSPG